MKFLHSAKRTSQSFGQNHMQSKLIPRGCRSPNFTKVSASKKAIFRGTHLSMVSCLALWGGALRDFSMRGRSHDKLCGNSGGCKKPCPFQNGCKNGENGEKNVIQWVIVCFLATSNATYTIWTKVCSPHTFTHPYKLLIIKMLPAWQCRS